MVLNMRALHIVLNMPEYAWRSSEVCRVLNMSDFWIFVNFRKNGRVLNIRWDAIIEGFWIFQDSDYAQIWLNNTQQQGSKYA